MATASIEIDYSKLLGSLLDAFNNHILGNDLKALDIISKPDLKKATDKDDFLRYFREGLQNLFHGMSLRFENVQYARQRARNSLVIFNSALESIYEGNSNLPPEEMEEQCIVHLYEYVLDQLCKTKNNAKDEGIDQDVRKIKTALKKWNRQESIKISQEKLLPILLIIFAKAVAHTKILYKLEPSPKDIQKKRGWNEPKIKDELERLLNIFTFVHLIAKNSHKLPTVVNREISRLFGALGYLYRGRVFFLLSDYSRENFWKAFNDFTNAERIVGAEVRQLAGKKGKDPLEICWKWHSASIYFAKGYLYQRAFAHYRAFENFSTGLDIYSAYFESNKNDFGYKSLTIAEIEVAQGKIFIELGQFKNAVLQFLKALERVFVIARSEKEMNGSLDINFKEISKSITLLENARQDALFEKEKFYKALSKFDVKVLEKDIFKPFKLFLSDLSSRLGFVLLVLFYRPDEPEKYAQLKAGRWLEVALQLDPNNGLANFNQLLSGAKKKIGKSELNFKNDSSIRRFLTDTLEALVNSNNDGELQEERNFFKQSITYSDSLIRKQLEINYYLSPDRKEKKDSLLILKRWSSSSPRVPRPTTFQMRGGGYVVFWNNKGIAIDPGFDFITNLYSEGYSINDIDAILVTHDHIDHTDDFDAIVALNYQLNRYNESTYIKPKPPVSLSLFLNTGFMEKYIPYLSLESPKNKRAGSSSSSYIDNIYTLAPHSTIDMTESDFRFKIEVIPAHHREISHDNYAVGFKLHLYDEKKKSFTLGFSSDTAYYEELGDKFSDCNIVIPHIGFVTFRELGQLMNLDIDKIVNATTTEYFNDVEEELRFFSALGFRDVKSWGDLREKWNSGNKAKHQGFLRQHLGYTGLKKVWKKMIDCSAENQLMVISEFHEETGSFRTKMAAALNHKKQKNNYKSAPTCFTGDVGLQLLLNKTDSEESARIRCTSCARDNDLTIEETFHAPEDITEVCVKAENEGIFYFCKEHVPDSEKEFREKVERFNLFR